MIIRDTRASKQEVGSCWMGKQGLTAKPLRAEPCPSDIFCAKCTLHPLHLCIYLWLEALRQSCMLVAGLWSVAVGEARVIGEDADSERCLALPRRRGESTAIRQAVWCRSKRGRGAADDSRKEQHAPRPSSRAGWRNGRRRG